MLQACPHPEALNAERWGGAGAEGEAEGGDGDTTTRVSSCCGTDYLGRAELAGSGGGL